jgi:riboflavin synthase
VFTGLVQGRGKVLELEPDGDGARLELETPLAAELKSGDSVALNGVCLTATQVDADRFAADLMPETFRRTSLGWLIAGDSVNVELPLRAGDPLGGHVVQGHVDNFGTIADIREEGFARVLRIEPYDPALLRYVVEKGSIAVDGVSLTVAAVDESGFEVSLIPETLERTTLGAAQLRRAVNLEVDVLAKYVEKLAARR